MKTRLPAARVLLPAALAAALAISLLAVGRTSAGGLPTVGLGAAESFAVLAGTPSIENTGLTVVTGNVGISPALAVNGFGGPPNGTVLGEIHAGDTLAGQAKGALVTAYDDAAGRPVTDTDATIGGRTLVSGVYNAGGATLDLTGTVILDGQNNPDAVWIFQATSDLVTASSSVVSLINGAQACNVFWQVTSSATLGSSSVFAGTIMALTSITVNANVAVNGRLLARDGTVTLISDIITRPSCATVTPTVAPIPVGAVPTATPQLPNTALDEGGEVVDLSPLFAIFGVVALTLVARRTFVASTRPR
jgi:hypothetical protein